MRATPPLHTMARAGRAKVARQGRADAPSKARRRSTPNSFGEPLSPNAVAISFGGSRAMMGSNRGRSPRSGRRIRAKTRARRPRGGGDGGWHGRRRRATPGGGRGRAIRARCRGEQEAPGRSASRPPGQRPDEVTAQATPASDYHDRSPHRDVAAGRSTAGLERRCGARPRRGRNERREHAAQQSTANSGNACSRAQPRRDA